MVALEDKDYVVIVQCHITKQRCTGFACEIAFHERSGGFAEYAKDKAYRTLQITCGGCCGRALNGKLAQLIRKLGKQQGIGKDQIVVQLSSCITTHNFHGPPCQHLDYLKTLIAQAGLDVRDGTWINKLSVKRREEGLYA